MEQFPDKLIYDKEASQWLEALPIGNGRLAAMVYGGVAVDAFQLNEGSIWAGGPHKYDNPRALEALPRIRKLVFEGKWSEAQELASEQFMSLPLKQMAYQTAGQMTLAVKSGAFTDYKRELDLDASAVRVSYTSAGARYTREAFASRPDGVIAIRLRAEARAAIDLTASLSTPHAGSAISVEGTDIVLNAVSGDSQGVAGQVRFQIRARLLPENGAITSDGKALTASAADGLLILLAIGTSYADYDDVSADPQARAVAALNAAAAQGYDALLARHLADYQRLYRRFSINLGGSELSTRATDERIATHVRDQDPALAALYCRYGRYLLISSSRANGLPATLQGLWNDSLTPPWGSKYTININTEMNYWPAGPGNLIECYAPLLEMISKLAEAGKSTARVHYGAAGWVAHHNTDGWLGTAPIDGPFSGLWPTGGAWLCKSIWDRYEFTGDEQVLADGYPALRGACEFFLDTLVEEPRHGWLVTNPSLSPENAHHPGCSICAGPAMDTQILRDLFDNTAEAARILGRDADFRDKLIETRKRLPPDQIGRQGQVQEWLDDWDPEAPEPHHRHNSHLYGLYPGAQITQATPDLYNAARRTLQLRGDESTGWSMAWRINLWARLCDGEHAHKMIASLLTPSRTAPNMFDLHPPFQIDGNFGGAAGIIELIVQSHAGAIDLLPALPTAWPTGSISGVLARGGFELSLRWADNMLTNLIVVSHAGKPCRLRCSGAEKRFETQKEKTYRVDGALNVVSESFDGARSHDAL